MLLVYSIHGAPKQIGLLNLVLEPASCLDHASVCA